MARTVIGQRFKLSGMHWTAAIAIATLRCQRASGPAGQQARSVTHRATRSQPPDQPNPPNELGYLQK